MGGASAGQQTHVASAGTSMETNKNRKKKEKRRKGLGGGVRREMSNALPKFANWRTNVGNRDSALQKKHPGQRVKKKRRRKGKVTKADSVLENIKNMRRSVGVRRDGRGVIK